MVEKIKIYIKNKKKIYVQVNDEILFFEEQSLEEVIENIKDEYELEENIGIDIIIHFMFIDFENGNKKYLEKLQNKFKYKEEKFYFNLIEDNYITFYLERNEIEKYKMKINKTKCRLLSIKIDFVGLYNKYKKENIEILQIGELESVRIKIKNEKIEEFERVDFKIEDVGDIENFDFGDMAVYLETEENIRDIFDGNEMYEMPNFLSKKELKFSKEMFEINWNKKDGILLFIVVVLCFLTFNSFSIKKIKEENGIIQQKIKEKEKKYLKQKEEKLPDYTNELENLSQISEQVNRTEYYSFIKFLMDSSKNGISYIKIIYENSSWIIQGEIDNFKKFNIFEKELKSKYKNIGLEYLKDSENATIFEYKVNIIK